MWNAACRSSLAMMGSSVKPAKESHGIVDGGVVEGELLSDDEVVDAVAFWCGKVENQPALVVHFWVPLPTPGPEVSRRVVEGKGPRTQLAPPCQVLHRWLLGVPVPKPVACLIGEALSFVTTGYTKVIIMKQPRDPGFVRMVL